MGRDIVRIVAETVEMREMLMLSCIIDHGEDWALAAVELGSQSIEWAKGNI